MIRLTPYQPAHLAALSTLQLPPQQEGFTAYPADLIPEAEADPDSLGVTILEGETPVGLQWVISCCQRGRSVTNTCPNLTQRAWQFGH